MQKYMTMREIEESHKNGTINQICPPASFLTEENTMIKLQGLINLPAKKYIIPRLEIERGTLASICAAGGSGKTMLTQYIAVCVSNGFPLFGQFETSKGRVIHIDMEQGSNQTLRRYERLASGLEINTVDIQRITLRTKLDEGDLEKIKKELVKLCSGAILVIIDSLKACTLAEENSDSIGNALQLLKQVAAESDTAVLIITHKGKKVNDARQSNRGHSVIYDKMDVQIDLTSKDNVYELVCTKNREGAHFAGLTYTLLDKGEFVESQNCYEKLILSLLDDKVETKNSDKQTAVLTILNNKEPINFSKLYEQIKGDKTDFSNMMDTLEAQKLVFMEKQGRAKIYSITDAGESYLAYSVDIKIG